MINVILTILLMAILIIALLKKFNLVTTLWVLGLGTLAIYTYTTGLPLVSPSSGSKFIDLFNLLSTTIGTQIQSLLIVAFAVMGYVSFMNHLGANQLFATLVCQPLKKLNAPLFVATGCIMIGGAIKIVVPDIVGLTALMIGIMYPIMMAVGCSKPTAASAMLIAGGFSWGPGNSISYLIFSSANITDYTVPQWFISHQLPVTLFTYIALIITFPFISKYFDKREGVGPVRDYNVESLEELGIPKLYGFLPVVPLIMMLLFSNIIGLGIVISVPAAFFFSLALAIIIECIRIKSIKKVFEKVTSFYSGMGEMMANAGFIMIAGNVFSQALSKVGGLTIIMNAVSDSAGSNGILLIIIAGVIAYLVVAAVGTVTGNMALLTPIFVEISKNTGIPLLKALVPLSMCGTLGYCNSLTTGAVLMIAGFTEVDNITIVKRSMIPLLACSAFGLLGTFILL